MSWLRVSWVFLLGSVFRMDELVPQLFCSLVQKLSSVFGSHRSVAGCLHFLGDCIFVDFVNTHVRGIMKAFGTELMHGFCVVELLMYCVYLS